MVTSAQKEIIDYAVKKLGISNELAEHVVFNAEKGSRNDQAMSLFTRLVVSKDFDKRLITIIGKFKDRFKELEDEIKTLTDLVADLEKRVK